MHDPNRNQLVLAARLLQPVLHELVFVGGCTIGLWITDEAAADIRTTDDVDAIVEVTSYGEYAQFSSRLRDLGFVEDTKDGAPLCRWLHGPVVLDVMPLDERILGFSNRWYRIALQTAVTMTLAPNLSMRVISAPLLAATKLEAFAGRGEGDLLGSHDIEDFVALVDGRPTLVQEVKEEQSQLRSYLASEARMLLTEPNFFDVLAGHLLPDAASQARISLLLQRLRQLAQADK